MMVPVPGGRYLPFEIGSGGVRHECVPLHREPRMPSPSPTLDRCGSPITRHTQCWWCGAPVYYHTNGNGDSVLFDELGPPWPIHPCWEEHRETRTGHVQRFLAGLPIFEVTTQDHRPALTEDLSEIQLTEDDRKRPIFVIGHIRSTSSDMGPNDRVFHNDGDLSEWGWVSIAGIDGIRYPVWLPTSRAARFKLQDLVALVCRLVVWNGEGYLVAMRATHYQNPIGPLLVQRMVHVGRTLRCRYCGDRLVGDDCEWGFDESLRPECAVCYEFRNGRNPAQFQELCRRVMRHGRTRERLPETNPIV
jgi:hypothetical protein